MRWTKVASDVGVGAAVGIVSEVASNMDKERLKTAAGKKLDFFAQIGNLVDYGVAIVGVALAGFKLVPEEWSSRLICAGATLAGKRAYFQVTQEQAKRGKELPFIPLGQAALTGATTGASRTAAWYPRAIKVE